MKKIEPNIKKLKSDYDKLTMEEHKLKQYKEEIERKIISLKEADRHKPLLVRLARKLFQRVAEILNIPTKRTIEMDNLHRKSTEAYEKRKSISAEKHELDNSQEAFETLEGVTLKQVEEYNKEVSERNQIINDLVIDKEKNPSRVVEEFNSIFEKDNSSNKFRILDYVLAKKKFIDTFHKKYNNYSTEIKTELSNTNAQKKKIYSNEVDIKDIEAALSFVVGQKVEFNWTTGHFKGENFECTVGGEMIGKNNLDPKTSKETIALMREYGETIAQTIKDIAEKKHPKLLMFMEDKDFKKSYKLYENGKNVDRSSYTKNNHQEQVSALSNATSCKCFLDSNLCTEYYGSKNDKRDNHPEKIMNYLFAKAEYSKNTNKTVNGISYHKDGERYIFTSGKEDKYQVFDINVNIKDIEAALSYFAEIPVHYDFSSNTFKSSLWEINSKGKFINSKTIPTKEYKKLSKFFKKYGEKTEELFKETAKREQPSLLTNNKEFIAVPQEFINILDKEVTNIEYNGGTMRLDDFDGDIDDLINSIKVEDNQGLDEQTHSHDDLDL